MCVTFFLFDSLKDFPLILAFNRDEVLERSTCTAHYWPDKPHILGGRDKVAGGTWLCFSVSSGRLAWLTNFWERTQPAVGPPSRGELPVNFVEGSATPLDYLASVDGSAYPGFNLLVADLASGQLGYLCNRAGAQPQAVAPGLHGVTNGMLDAPWVKLEHGKAALQALVDEGAFQGGEVPWDQIFQVMSDDRVLEADPSNLPTLPSPEFQRAASSIFVKPTKTFLGTCGTRSQTVIAVWRDGTVEWREQYMKDDGHWGEVRHRLQLQLWGGQEANGGSGEQPGAEEDTGEREAEGLQANGANPSKKQPGQEQQRQRAEEAGEGPGQEPKSLPYKSWKQQEQEQQQEQQQGEQGAATVVSDLRSSSSWGQQCCKGS